MKKGASDSWIYGVAIAGVAASSGCASGQSKNDPPPETAPFVANVTANPVPIPVAVELATEMNKANNLSGSQVPKNNSRGRYPSGSASSKIITHVVQDGDTLMKIAFEHLGDLLRWREIYEDNKEKIINPNSLQKGLVLNIRTNGEVLIRRNGDPYDIRRGDTLGKISRWVYGTVSKWRRLWENNRELIRHPDKIYAGFRLYYTMTPEERIEFNKLRQLPQMAPKPLANSSPVDQSIGKSPIPIPIEAPRKPASESK